MIMTLFPPTLQDVRQNLKLCAYKTIKAAIKQLDKRGKTHTMKLNIKGNLCKVYIDKFKNVVFRETTFLNPVHVPKHTQGIAQQSDVPVQNPRSFASFINEMVVSKFDQKQNPEIWLQSFEKEALRVTITKDEFAEALHHFFKGSGD